MLLSFNWAINKYNVKLCALWSLQRRLMITQSGWEIKYRKTDVGTTSFMKHLFFSASSSSSSSLCIFGLMVLALIHTSKNQNVKKRTKTMEMFRKKLSKQTRSKPFCYSVQIREYFHFSIYSRFNAAISTKPSVYHLLVIQFCTSFNL